MGDGVVDVGDHLECPGRQAGGFTRLAKDFGRPLGAAQILRRNLLIWGLGGVVVPFVGIKLIDMALAALHLVA